MPILGVIASGRTGSTISTASYESIQTISVGSGGQSTVDFTSIPATYTHLQLRGISRSLRTGSGLNTFNFTVNGSATGYWYHALASDGATAYAFNAGSSTSSFYGGFTTRAGDTANVFQTFIIDILDYKSTTKNKVIRQLWGVDTNDVYGTLSLTSGSWTNTAAINQITFSAVAGNIDEFSHIALYGIKG